MEVEILDTYMALFTEQNKLDEPRFFRKLKLNSKGQIAATKEKIGQHTAENIGKAVAGILRLLNPGDFTGHCWRRTAATLMAESGLTVPQMKSATGHGSERVMQRYVDNTHNQKSIAANALAAKPSSSSSSNQKRQYEEAFDVENENDVNSAPIKYIASSSSSSRTAVYKPETGTTNINLNLSNVTAPVTIQVGSSSKAVLGPTEHATQQIAATENTTNNSN